MHLFRSSAAKTVDKQLNLPYVGIPPGILGPWRAGFNYFRHSEEYIREGYRKVRILHVDHLGCFSDTRLKLFL